MASVAFVTTEHDEAPPSPTKLPQTLDLQGGRSTESPTGFTPPASRWPSGDRSSIREGYGRVRQPISRSLARERRKKRNTEISSRLLADSRRDANEVLHGFVQSKQNR